MAAHQTPKQQLPKIPPSQLVLPEVTPVTRLLYKRRQQFEADEALVAAKQQHATQEVAFRAREEALKRRDLELQESLLRFTRFLQENDAKRAKAARRATEEARLRAEREAEIVQLQGEAEACCAERERMQAALQRIVKYQHYCQSVVEAGDTGFQEVDDILARHATLRAANTDLRQQQAACGTEAERVRGQTAAYAKAKASELLDLNNRLAALKKQAEATAAEAAALEAAAEYGRRAAADRQLELSQVLATAANLYRRCLQRSRVARAKHEASPLAQLEAVAHFLGDLRVALMAAEAGP
ncbi:hypothetical protein D9Q98_001567 [Chlorella vulgaris]|uniref:DUF4200 domain-containing protein n=1 Tax=Chlorella vulgaris TaxID=3077 RepID=A0A9D4TV11_CHLVU|nr:hypothetical protein D9Q98_001567 [Chlorella vulgaris]